MSESSTGETRFDFDFFLSYPHSAHVTAKKLADALSQRAAVFGEWALQPGDAWDVALNNALQRSRVGVVLVENQESAPFYQSEEIAAMVDLSRRKRDFRLVPVYLSEAAQTNVPYGLRLVQGLLLDDPADVNVVAEQLLESVGLLGTDRRPDASDESVLEERNRGYVFISYATPDREFVQRLVTFFEDRGYLYFDFLSSDRDYQARMHLELEQRIRNARVMVCVVSPAWKKSQWAVKEMMYAEVVGIPTFLLKFRELEPTLLIVDRTTIDFAEDVELGFGVLERELDRRSL